jgi:hypothetical protein
MATHRSTRARRARRAAAALALASAQLLAGCYTYVPRDAAVLAREAPPGARVALDVNDAGRAALAPTLAPGITRVEGTLLGTRGDTLLLALAGYSQIRRPNTRLVGDTLRLWRQHLEGAAERRLSTRRTALLVGVGVAVVATFFIGRGLGGRGVPPESRGPDGGDNQ